MDSHQNAGVICKGTTRTFSQLSSRDKYDCTIVPGKMEDEMTFNIYILKCPLAVVIWSRVPETTLPMRQLYRAFI